MKTFLFISTWLSTVLFANPSSPIVISGNATFDLVANTLTVQTTSDRTIINWDDFSIASNETTKFIQPGSASATLNRVTTANVSNLLGQLRSNGEVFLINPNGILVGNGARVDVGAFVASSLDVLDAEFLLGGDMTFSGSSTATIQNDGVIEGIFGAFILGRHIVNAGDIYAKFGNACLGAGDSVLLLADKAGIMINLNAGTPSGTGVINSGGLVGNHTCIKANGNLYALAIHHSGWVTAYTMIESGGEVVLRADFGETRLDGKGQLYAQSIGGLGGRISIEGETVTLNDQARVTVSNLSDGGTIYVGGSAGADPSILDAQNTTITTGVVIEADAHLDGNGGDVVVYSLETTNFAGVATAKGGAAGGNGGTVEISGVGNLIFTGQVDTTAPVGLAGLLILDPTDITISDADTDLNITALNNALNKNNVLVTTNSPFVGTGDITWSTETPLTLTSSHTLTLLADNDIIFTTRFSMEDKALGSSEVTFQAGGDITLSQLVTGTNLAAMTIDAGNNVLLNEGISASGAILTVMVGNDIMNQGADVSVPSLFASSGE